MECDGKQQRQQPYGNGVDQVHCSASGPDLTLPIIYEAIIGIISDAAHQRPEAKLVPVRIIQPFLSSGRNVHFWLLADIATNPRDVRFEFQLRTLGGYADMLVLK